MSDSNQPSNSEPVKRKLSLEPNQVEETLVVETGEENDEVVLASNTDGSSLTLLEEYSKKRASYSRLTTLLSLFCAATSVTFAFMIFKTL